MTFLLCLLFFYLGGAVSFYLSERAIFFELEDDPNWRRAACWAYVVTTEHINFRNK